MTRLRTTLPLLLLLLGLSVPALADNPPKTTHAFLACGAQTAIHNGDGTLRWTYPESTRDGWVLPDGRILLTLGKSPAHPGGAVLELEPTPPSGGKPLFTFEGTQSEVNTAQKLAPNRYLISEAGDHPRLLEVDSAGKTLNEIPLKAQTRDHHLQTRMARKLPNGHYLVPQLLDKVVREYTQDGQITWEVATPDMPFTAIRLPNGHTLIGCTLGNLVIEVDAKGQETWRLTNNDLPGAPINDACGVQRLPNGNTVLTSHHAQGNAIKLLEVTPQKQLTWTYQDPNTPGIHNFQILETNNQPLPGPPLR